MLLLKMMTMTMMMMLLMLMLTMRKLMGEWWGVSRCDTTPVR